jgi:hypothetical protein
MFPDAAFKVVGYSCVQCLGAVAHDVNVIELWGSVVQRSFTSSIVSARQWIAFRMTTIGFDVCDV